MRTNDTVSTDTPHSLYGCHSGVLALLHDDRRAGKVAELGQGVGERAAGEAGAEVGQALALHGRDDLLAVGDCVVAAGQRPSLRDGLLVGELPRVALVAVDDDLQVRDPLARAVGRSTLGRACLGGRAVCQKIAWRPPRMRVMTNWERFSRRRSRTRSMAAPRLVQERVGMRSTMSASSGHSWVRWQ